MRLSRLAGLVIVAVLAMGLMTAATASAEPEFNPGTLNRFDGTSGTGSLANASTEEVTCKTDTSTGEITGIRTVGSVVVVFHGCTSPEAGGCEVNSVGETPGLISTTTLVGELGLTKESATSVGLLLKPASGTKFTELTGPCLAIKPAPVTGSIAGEARPIGKPASLIGTLSFVGAKGIQNITKIEVLGKVEKPELLAFGLVKASETTNETILYEKDVEVT
jgi:hypothetical protein